METYWLENKGDILNRSLEISGNSEHFLYSGARKDHCKGQGGDGDLLAGEQGWQGG